MISPHVLVVEDDDSVRSLLVMLLRAEGYDASEAKDGSIALEVADQRRPDLVILDLMLPGVDGEAVVRGMWASPSLVDVPVVVVSAKYEALDDLRDLIGADNVFPKPFDEDNLMARVEQILGPAI
ncbi:MAG: response regulator transcription factor [Actinomycetota bacterium]|nr:response regulator [Actinomycetota bacterium]